MKVFVVVYGKNDTNGKLIAATNLLFAEEKINDSCSEMKGDSWLEIVSSNFCD